VVASAHVSLQPASPIRARIQQNFAERLHDQIGVLGWEVSRDPQVPQGGNSRAEQLSLGVAGGSGGFTLLIEILPPGRDSLAEHQRLASIRTLAGLRELVIVNTTRQLVELWTRSAEGRWNLAMVDDPEGEIRLPSLGVAIPMREIYRRVSFGQRPFPGAV